MPDHEHFQLPDPIDLRRARHRRWLMAFGLLVACTVVAWAHSVRHMTVGMIAHSRIVDGATFQTRDVTVATFHGTFEVSLARTMIGVVDLDAPTRDQATGWSGHLDIESIPTGWIDSSVATCGFDYDSRIDRGIDSTAQSHRLRVPLIAPAAVATPFVWLMLVRDARRRRAVAAGRCLGCGYDLRGSTDRCPECRRGFGPARLGSSPSGLAST